MKKTLITIFFFASVLILNAQKPNWIGTFNIDSDEMPFSAGNTEITILQNGTNLIAVVTNEGMWQGEAWKKTNNYAVSYKGNYAILTNQKDQNDIVILKFFNDSYYIDFNDKWVILKKSKGKG